MAGFESTTNIHIPERDAAAVPRTGSLVAGTLKDLGGKILNSSVKNLEQDKVMEAQKNAYATALANPNGILSNISPKEAGESKAAQLHYQFIEDTNKTRINNRLQQIRAAGIGMFSADNHHGMFSDFEGREENFKNLDESYKKLLEGVTDPSYEYAIRMSAIETLEEATRLGVEAERRYAEYENTVVHITKIENIIEEGDISAAPDAYASLSILEKEDPKLARKNSLSLRKAFLNVDNMAESYRTLLRENKGDRQKAQKEMLDRIKKAAEANSKDKLYYDDKLAGSLIETFARAETSISVEDELIPAMQSELTAALKAGGNPQDLENIRAKFRILLQNKTRALSTEFGIDTEDIFTQGNTMLGKVAGPFITLAAGAEADVHKGYSNYFEDSTTTDDKGNISIVDGAKTRVNDAMYKFYDVGMGTGNEGPTTFLSGDEARIFWEKHVQAKGDKYKGGFTDEQLDFIKLSLMLSPEGKQHLIAGAIKGVEENPNAGSNDAITDKLIKELKITDTKDQEVFRNVMGKKYDIFRRTRKNNPREWGFAKRNATPKGIKLPALNDGDTEGNAAKMGQALEYAEGVIGQQQKIMGGEFMPSREDHGKAGAIVAWFQQNGGLDTAQGQRAIKLYSELGDIASRWRLNGFVPSNRIPAPETTQAITDRLTDYRLDPFSRSAIRSAASHYIVNVPSTAFDGIGEKGQVRGASGDEGTQNRQVGNSIRNFLSPLPNVEGKRYVSTITEQHGQLNTIAKWGDAYGYAEYKFSTDNDFSTGVELDIERVPPGTSYLEHTEDVPENPNQTYQLSEYWGSLTTEQRLVRQKPVGMNDDGTIIYALLQENGDFFKVKHTRVGVDGKPTTIQAFVTMSIPYGGENGFWSR